jgi:HEPN domain-containing protein
MFMNDPSVTDTACFHAQQCAEKMLKAFLTLKDIHVERTHDLARLLSQCVPLDPEFGVLADAADTLNPYAVEVRYADDWRDIPPEEAGTAVGLAEKFTDFILPRLGLSPEEQRPWQKA